jgi:hypothetical protein
MRIPFHGGTKARETGNSAVAAAGLSCSGAAVVTNAVSPSGVSTPAELIGVWRRELLAEANGRHDVTTKVTWLQASSTFVDLRAPAGRPSFDEVKGLRDLTVDQVRWIASQEAFAGELTCRGEYFEWLRPIDLHPPRATPDAGTLELVGNMLVERGWYQGYLEQYRYDPVAAGPVWSRTFLDPLTGGRACVVRVGSMFAWARDQRRPLDGRHTLLELIERAPSLAAKQDLVDFEVSCGEVSAGGWTITASTLPFLEGSSFDVDLRGWTVAHADGEVIR